MTEIIAFEQLTWPEVIKLPRTLPFGLPLGNGHSKEIITAAMGYPERLVILPAIPYGWIGSGLALPMEIFKKVLDNLRENLLEDGFTEVYILTPVDLGLGAVQRIIPMENELSEFSLPSPGENVERVALVPVGQIEQHALHLPLSVDTVCIDAITQGTVQACSEKTFRLPVFPYGVSTHRKAFAGTFNIGGRAFEDFFLAVVDALTDCGFEMIYLMSGHGGNVSFLTTVVKYAGELYPQSFIATSWLYLSGPKGIAALESSRNSAIGGMGHACELETSLMLHLYPELVRMERVVDEVDFISTPSYYQDWVEGGALIANPPWEDDTTTGAYGAGSLATAEKGAFWLGAAIEEKVTQIGEIIEQHERRKMKRANR